MILDPTAFGLGQPARRAAAINHPRGGTQTICQAKNPPVLKSASFSAVRHATLRCEEKPTRVQSKTRGLFAAVVLQTTRESDGTRELQLDLARE